MKGIRGERLSSQFQREISAVISGDIRNKYPRLSAIISVTGVDVAPDLKSCRAYISIFDPDEERKRESFEILKENAGSIRHALSGVMHIRTVPEIRFVADNSMEYGTKIDNILKGLDTPTDEEGDD